MFTASGSGVSGQKRCGNYIGNDWVESYFIAHRLLFDSDMWHKWHIYMWVILRWVTRKHTTLWTYLRCPIDNSKNDCTYARKSTRNKLKRHYPGVDWLLTFSETWHTISSSTISVFNGQAIHVRYTTTCAWSKFGFCFGRYMTLIADWTWVGQKRDCASISYRLNETTMCRSESSSSGNRLQTFLPELTVVGRELSRCKL